MSEETPFVLLSTSLTAQLSASEPWPEDAKLYQPFRVEQMILPEFANILSIKTFLNMCSLKYQVEMRSNAESMSPDGEVPFLKCGSFVISGFEQISELLNSKGVSLISHLDKVQKADMRAYMSLVKMVLSSAELFLSWSDKTTFNEVTKPRYTTFFPWPINHFIGWQKKWDVKKKLETIDWKHKSDREMYEEVKNCCDALSERLDTQDYFFGDKPTELDALVFGHLFAILNTSLPDNKFSSIIRENQNLVDLCCRIDSKYFQKTLDLDEDTENIET